MKSGGRYGATRAYPAAYSGFWTQTRKGIPTSPFSGHAIRLASSVVTGTGVERLNEGQRDCLRLVLAHHNSKEIARQLGVSPHTVDQRLRTAIRILDVQSRFEAARKFAVHDQEFHYQPLIYQRPDIEMKGGNGKLGPSTERTRGDETGLNGGVANGEGRLAAKIFDGSVNSRRRLPVPHYHGEKNNLGTVERMVWILLIAIASALSFGGLIAGLEALSRLRG